MDMQDHIAWPVNRPDRSWSRPGDEACCNVSGITSIKENGETC